ncbi:MAG: 4-hydroxy-3-methylbut-2-enyl diphosphate reductase [Pseudomonadota bacterium]
MTVEQTTATDGDGGAQILLAAPRGFCAGVDRAIQIVELALEQYGAPVYVRHEIVHNRHVVEGLEAKGAVFVDELDEIPNPDAPVIFSAHGVPKSVPADAQARNMFYIDATCPLVSKVHLEADRLHGRDFEIVLIGHDRHPEVVGTMGQLPPGAITLIETVADAQAFEPKDPAKLAFVTQTTLSVDDTAEIVATLQERFPQIQAPAKEDICYATTNRQASVKAIADRCDWLFVVGAPNSSNSLRLVEVGLRAGASEAMLVRNAAEVPLEAIKASALKAGRPLVFGVTAGASAPEVLINELVTLLQTEFGASLDVVETAKETVTFKLPKVLRDGMAA